MRAKYFFLMLFTLSLLAGCNEDLNILNDDTPPVVEYPGGGGEDEDLGELEVTLMGETEGEVEVAAGADIYFRFSGSADQVEFWNGEYGHAYANRDRVSFDPTELGVSLSFSCFARYGYRIGGKYPTGEDSYVKVYLSTSFPGLLGNNKAKDEQNIAGASWIDITSACDMPLTSATSDAATNFTNIDISQHVAGGGALSIAFKYSPIPIPNSEPKDQGSNPRFQVQNLMMTMDNKVVGTKTQYLAKELGFKPINLNDDVDPYNDAANSTAIAYGRGRTWYTYRLYSPSVPNTPEFCVQDGKAEVGVPPAEWKIPNAWIISNPVDLGSCEPDTGVTIRSKDRPIEQQIHNYAKPGTYTASFVVKNQGEEPIVKEFTIKVK